LVFIPQQQLLFSTFPTSLVQLLLLVTNTTVSFPDDACSQRFNNLSKACLKWIMAREAIQQNPMYQTRDEDQLTGMENFPHSTGA
jgi:hypothetical protein